MEQIMPRFFSGTSEIVMCKCSNIRRSWQGTETWWSW